MADRDNGLAVCLTCGLVFDELLEARKRGHGVEAIRGRLDAEEAANAPSWSKWKASRSAGPASRRSIAPGWPPSCDAARMTSRGSSGATWRVPAAC